MIYDNLKSSFSSEDFCSVCSKCTCVRISVHAGISYFQVLIELAGLCRPLLDTATNYTICSLKVEEKWPQNVFLYLSIYNVVIQMFTFNQATASMG